MNARTRLSSKGQIVIPKDVRDRLRWTPGTELDVAETPEGLMIRARPGAAKKLTVEEAVARLREIAAPYQPFPPSTDEDWAKSIDRMFREDYEDR